MTYTLRDLLRQRAGRDNHDITVHKVYKDGDNKSRSDDPVLKISIRSGKTYTDCPTQENL